MKRYTFINHLGAVIQNEKNLSVKLKHLAFLILPLLLVSSSASAKFKASATGISYEQGYNTLFQGIDTFVVFEKIAQGNSPSMYYIYPDSNTYTYTWYKVSSAGETVVAEEQNVYHTQMDLSAPGFGEGTYRIQIKNLLVDESVYFAAINYENYPAVPEKLIIHDDGETPSTFLKCKYAVLEAVYAQNTIEVFDPILNSNKELIPYKKEFKWSWDGGEKNTTLASVQVAAVYEPTVYTNQIVDNFFLQLPDETDDKMQNPESTEPYDNPIAVKMDGIKFTINERAGDNEANKGELVGDNLQGSAPLDVNFEVKEPSHAVQFQEWSVFRGEDSNRIAVDYNALFRYVFNSPLGNPESKAADYTLKLLVSNEAKCLDTASLGIKLEVSHLAIPNLFVIGFQSEYDYRADYRSLKPGTFRGYIYNRMGRRVYHWTDPTQGWDGRRGGSSGFVSPGAYVVVLRAEGTDGQKFKIRHSLTIIREK